MNYKTRIAIIQDPYCRDRDPEYAIQITIESDQIRSIAMAMYETEDEFEDVTNTEIQRIDLME